tara:strand:+ start:604 stop:1017 length:414 start_codon:yes stop_codon:yes gene_type:complete
MYNIEQQLSATVQGVIDGEVSSLEAYGNLKMLEKYLANCIDEIKEATFLEADRFADKTFLEAGFKFTKTDGKANYNFKGLSHWEQKKAELKEMEAMAKASAQNQLKFKTALVTEDGEVIEPCKISYSSPSISVSVNK